MAQNATKTAQSGKQPKKRIDLHVPRNSAAQYSILATLLAQAILADHCREEIFILVCVAAFFIAPAVQYIVTPKTRTEPGDAKQQPNFGVCGMIVLYGLMFEQVLGPTVFWWGTVGLAGVCAPLIFFSDRRRARLEAEKRRAPTFRDKTGEDRVHLVDLSARIAVLFAWATGPFTEAQRDTILDTFTHKLSYEGARLGSIRVIIAEEVEHVTAWEKQRLRDWPKTDTERDLVQDLLDWQFRGLLLRFRHSCSYESHLTLLALLFRVAQASEQEKETALDLAREIGLALDLEPQVLRDIEAQSRVSEAERAQEEARRQREESERQERTERARREQERAERRRREEAKRKRRQEEEEARRRAYEQTYRAEASREEQALAVLGLDSGAKFSAIKKRYRRLIVQHHPDKVAHLGEAARRAAEEKTKKLNAAYSYLEERYGR